MTYQEILPEPVRAYKPGLVWHKPVECRPRPSSADLQLHAAPADTGLDSPPPKVYDHTTVRFRPGASPRQIGDYYRRRRHLFSWPPYRNAPPT
jgi:hypothetical protein